MSSKELIKETDERMAASVDHLRQELSKIRTGRAHPSLLDHLRVEYYGNMVPISQAAGVTVSDARTLTVQPWEKAMVAPIEKAILESDLGLNPNTAGTTIRINLPPLTEERRRELAKVVHAEGEHGKVAIRNIRRDANHHVKDLLNKKELTEDDARKLETDIQQLTDRRAGEVDKLVEAKEAEMMEV